MSHDTQLEDLLYVRDILAERGRRMDILHVATPMIATSAPTLDYIDQVFGPGGFLSKKIRGYQPRPGQVEMARKIDEAIRGAKHLVAEGPTGTGKSMSYLVPAVWHAVHHKLRVLVVTANKALQSQLVKKDLPDLQAAVPWKFSFSMLKGRSNYICKDKVKHRPWERDKKLGELETMRQLRVVQDWAKTTSSGDMSELSIDPDRRVWGHFSISADDCKRTECRFYDDCFSNLAKRKAAESNVLVVNYAMFFAHLAYEAKKNEGAPGILPGFDIAILDEGHNAADIARDFFGGDGVNHFSVLAATSGINTHSGLKFSMKWPPGVVDAISLREHIVAESEQLFEVLLRMENQGLDGYSKRLRAKDKVGSERLEVLLATASVFYEKAAAVLNLRDPIESEMAASKAKTCLKLSAKLTDFRKRDASGIVSFIESRMDRGQPRAELKSRAIRVGGWLRKHLFEKVDSVIMASATLQVEGGFAHLRQEVGVEDPIEVVVQSPFDWQKQAMLVVESSMPEPNDRVQFPLEVAERFAKIIEMTKGRTLGLFTSHKMVEAVHERIKGGPWRVLRQGTGSMPKEQLIEEFKRDKHSVLIGTSSLWEGVDVPGDSLICVVIDRLPFCRPDDPVMDALQELEDDVFQRYGVPQAIIAFKQGVGRLIRSVSDRGVVVCLDRRVLSKGYGKRFIKSLPPLRVESSIEHIGSFLREAGVLA